MAISFADNINIRNQKQNVERDSFKTIEAMVNYNTNYLPNIFIATNEETGKLYIYNVNNAVDDTLGRWRELSGGSGTSDYTSLTNKPSLEGVTINGAKSASDFGLALSTDIPTNVSDLNNDSGYITNIANDLVYYYNKTQVNNLFDQQDAKIGDLATLKITSVNDLVSAINVLYNNALKSVSFADKILTFTYNDGSTLTVDISALITSAKIGDLSNVSDGSIEDKQVLQFNASTLAYEPATLDTSSQYDAAKEYTDQQIEKLNETAAIACDSKPTYDSTTETVTYIKDGETLTTTESSWFYYTNTTDNSVYQTRWIDGVEFSILVSDSAKFDEYVNKTEDVLSTYTGNEADKTKVPNYSALDALVGLINNSLSLKVNTSDIVDNLTSTDTDKPLSAYQGKILSDNLAALGTNGLATADITTSITSESTNAEVAGAKAVYDALSAHTSDTDIHISADERTSWNSKTSIDDTASSVSTTYSSSKIDTALSGKVDTVTGKGLSTNDLTDDLKESYDSAVTNSHSHSNISALNNVSQSVIDNSHSHSNKAVLDTITSAQLDAIGANSTAISDLNDALANKQDILTFDEAPTADSTNSVTSGGIYSAYEDVVSNSHTHDNKDTLDTITSDTITQITTNTTNIETLVAKNSPTVMSFTVAASSTRTITWTSESVLSIDYQLQPFQGSGATWGHISVYGSAAGTRTINFVNNVSSNFWINTSASTSASSGKYLTFVNGRTDIPVQVHLNIITAPALTLGEDVAYETKPSITGTKFITAKTTSIYNHTSNGANGTANTYYQLSDAWPTTAVRTNTYIVTFRNNETYLLVLGTSDSGTAVDPIIYQINNGTNKLMVAYYDLDSKVLVFYTGAFTTFEVNQISGAKADFSVTSSTDNPLEDSTKLVPSQMLSSRSVAFTKADDGSRSASFTGVIGHTYKIYISHVYNSNYYEASFDLYDNTSIASPLKVIHDYSGISVSNSGASINITATSDISSSTFNRVRIVDLGAWN